MGRRKTSLVALKEISEINMTPLMDLTFILLITFIITFPLIEQGIPVNLPKGDAADLDNPDKTYASIPAFFCNGSVSIGIDELYGKQQLTFLFNKVFKTQTPTRSDIRPVIGYIKLFPSDISWECGALKRCGM